MKNLILIVIGSITIWGQAQSFDDLIKTADKFYKESKYSESGNSYRQAFSIKKGSATQYYNAACSFALAGNTDEALKHLTLSAESGWISLDHIKRDTDLNSLHETSQWGSILEKIQANIDYIEKDYDKPLQKKLEDIYVKDQTLRQLLFDAQKKFGKDSQEMIYFRNLMAQQDSIIEIEVIKIIDEKGWVGRSVVGGKANTALWLVIQHAPLETQEKYIPLLRRSVQEGESQGNHLALLEDRIQVRNGKPQIYGSQFTTDKETGNQILFEIHEPEYVNQRRRSIGLGPIEIYLKRRGISWDVEQKER